jgi:hypothetical protein
MEDLGLEPAEEAGLLRALLVRRLDSGIIVRLGGYGFPKR